MDPTVSLYMMVLDGIGDQRRPFRETSLRGVKMACVVPWEYEEKRRGVSMDVPRDKSKVR
jgi:hypothetical protein